MREQIKYTPELFQDCYEAMQGYLSATHTMQQEMRIIEHISDIKKCFANKQDVSEEFAALFVLIGAMIGERHLSMDNDRPYASWYDVTRYGNDEWGVWFLEALLKPQWTLSFRLRYCLDVVATRASWVKVNLKQAVDELLAKHHTNFDNE